MDYIVPCYDVLHTFSREYIEQAFDLFYRSKTFELISDGVADMHCLSDEYLAEEVEREISGELK